VSDVKINKPMEESRTHSSRNKSIWDMTKGALKINEEKSLTFNMDKTGSVDGKNTGAIPQVTPNKLITPYGV
jgi:hypothetical protein